ncbi:hypothetical protein M3Y94_00450500 [Aphelenchoides besseyi]|nr:hypothetical protein M3Y94_00450500 [Aphelenchoides besseyi]
MSSIGIVHGGLTADGQVIVVGLSRSFAVVFDEQQRGDSIDITLDDQFSELSAILETTEPLSEHDSAATGNRTVNSVEDADEKTEPADLSHTLEQLETTHVPSFDDPIAQSAEIDAIAAGLTPAENEEVLTEVQLIEQTAEAPAESSVGSMDIEEIIHHKHMEEAKEEPQKETEDVEATTKVENEVRVEEKTDDHLEKPQDEIQQNEESTIERSNQRPELETLIEQLTEGYDRSQPEVESGSFDQSEDPEIPEDAIEDNLPQQSTENETTTEAKNEGELKEQTFKSTNEKTVHSPIHVEPRSGEDGFLEDASLSEHNQSTDKVVDLNSSHQKDDSNTLGLFVWSALTASGLPVINGLCIRNRVDFDSSDGAIEEESDKPDQSENKKQSDETDESTRPQHDDQLPDVGQNPTDEERAEPKGAEETEKQAETSALNLISMTPVESANEDATKVVTPEPNSSLLLAPRSPAPFVLRPETVEQVAVGQLVVDIDAPIESEKLPAETPTTVVNRPAANEERKPRRSVDLPATPLSFHSFSSAAQIYAPVSPPLREAIGAVDSSRIDQPTVPSTRNSTTTADVPLKHGSELRPTDEVNQLVSGILTRLRHLQMADPPKYANIVERLHALESEMSMQNTGVPADPELTELVGRILAVDYPQSDLQIVVSTSRKTTSTTQFYETETPGMVGLAPEQLRELQQKLMNKISGTTDYGTALKSNEQPDGLKQRNATEEAWTSADGNEAVTKRTIRQSTTTHSGITGAGDHELKDQLIRLKINRQVYDGQLDGHHIRLIPIQQITANYY